MARYPRTPARIDASARVDILVFLCIALGLSWIRFIPLLSDRIFDTDVADSLLLWLTPMASLSPLIAALTVVTLRSGGSGARSFLRMGWIRDVPRRWYLIALVLLPLLFYGGALPIYLVIDGTTPELGQVQWLLLVEIFTLGLLLFLAEEYGWRGYLQRVIQPGRSVVVVSIAVGVVWALWHAPLLSNPDAIQSDLHAGWYFAFVIGISIIFGLVFTETNGSVVLVTLLHASWNASAGFLLANLASESIDTTPYLAICTTVTWLAAGVVLARTIRSRRTASVLRR